MNLVAHLVTYSTRARERQKWIAKPLHVPMSRRHQRSGVADQRLHGTTFCTCGTKLLGARVAPSEAIKDRIGLENAKSVIDMDKFRSTVGEANVGHFHESKLYWEGKCHQNDALKLKLDMIEHSKTRDHMTKCDVIVPSPKKNQR